MTELFEYLGEWQVLVCKPCRRGVPPASLSGHLRSYHSDYCRSLNPPVQREEFVARLQAIYALRDPEKAAVIFPPPDTPAIAVLDGFDAVGCLQCSYVVRNKRDLKSHYRVEHVDEWRRIYRRPRGRPHLPNTATEEQKKPPFWQAVYCQRFFSSGPQSQFFRVLSPGATQGRQEELERLHKAQTMNSTDFVRDQVWSRIQQDRDASNQSQQQHWAAAPTSEASDWLDLTRWRDYLNGHKLSQVAPLARAADPEIEPELGELSRSIDRLVERAHTSIRSDRINVFDQTRINSFHTRARAFDRPLMVKLQQSSYRQYKYIWKRLVCFAVRSTRPSQAVRLSHQLTAEQAVLLEELCRYAEQAVMARKEEPNTRPHPLQAALAALDRSCLLFCVSVLDHDLRRSIHENVALGFLAAMGIDERGQTLLDPCQHAPVLSRFIKITQMLVVERAVLAKDEGDSESASQAIDELRERFLVSGTRSPFAWASRLRMYAAKVGTNTTSLDFISWTDDQTALSYRGTYVKLEDFKALIAVQMRAAQEELADLFLLSRDETRDDVSSTGKRDEIVLYEHIIE